MTIEPSSHRPLPKGSPGGGLASRWRFRLIDLVLLVVACALLASAVRHFLLMLANLSDPSVLVFGLIMLAVSAVVGHQISKVSRARVMVAVASLAVVLLVIYAPNLAQQGDYTLLAFCAMALGSFFGTTYGILYGPLIATVIADAPDETSSAEKSPVEVDADDP